MNREIIQSATRTTRIYLICMLIFWLVKDLIAACYPSLIDLFRTVEGVKQKLARFQTSIGYMMGYIFSLRFILIQF